MDSRGISEMNLLNLKVGDRVTLTALYNDVREGSVTTKILPNDNDINIYAEDSNRGRRERSWVFFQYIGNSHYQYSSCNLDYDIPTESYTIKDIKIEKKFYHLPHGWGSSNGIYLVQPFNNNLSFMNWLDVNPFEVKQ
jgi:hypothetical protein